MNWQVRGMVGVLFGVALCGAPGCSQDNEVAVENLSKSMGDPGAKNPNEKKGDVANSPDARAARVKNVSDQKKAMQGPNYPKN